MYILIRKQEWIVIRQADTRQVCRWIFRPASGVFTFHTLHLLPCSTVLYTLSSSGGYDVPFPFHAFGRFALTLPADGLIN